MEVPIVGTCIMIESIKHDGALHRRWMENVVLYQDDDVVVGYNNRTIVKEPNQSIWQTNEPAIFYFDRRYWFNIVLILTDQPFFYCNLSTPFTFEAGVLQYIDYDLDVIVQTDGSYQVVDEDEYKKNGDLYQYPPSVRQSISEHLDVLIKWITANKGPFDPENMQYFYTLYKNKMSK